MDLVLESGLPQDAVKCAGGKVILRMPSNGHPSHFNGVFVLSMTALLGNHDPTIFLYYTQNFSNSHDKAFLESFSDFLANYRHR